MLDQLHVLDCDDDRVSEDLQELLVFLCEVEGWEGATPAILLVARAQQPYQTLLAALLLQQRHGEQRRAAARRRAVGLDAAVGGVCDERRAVLPKGLARPGDVAGEPRAVSRAYLELLAVPVGHVLAVAIAGAQGQEA